MVFKSSSSQINRLKTFPRWKKRNNVSIFNLIMVYLNRFPDGTIKFIFADGEEE
jgi:hypothetical protein